MGLKCGIVGLPNVGKSTLFNCLTNARAQAANFPFCTIEPNVGMITVPDERLMKLAELVKPEKVVPTTVEIVDIAGLVKGASKGEGLGNQFLSNIRECNAIIHVLRCFDNPNVAHVDGSVNPVRDKEIVDTELQLKDLESVEKKLARMKNIVKSGTNKEIKKELEVLVACKEWLEKGNSIRSIQLREEDKVYIADLMLLSAKPVLYLCNVDEQSVKTGNKHVDAVQESVKSENGQVIFLAAALEAEIAQLERYEDKKMFLQDAGLDEPGVNKLIRAAYKLLNLKTYFTAGKKEVRAWTISNGMTAPQAAGVIHTDFEKGFIKAEVIKYDDYVALGSELACRESGKLAHEGKEYVVEDGDIIHFRFNV